MGSNFIIKYLQKKAQSKCVVKGLGLNKNTKTNGVKKTHNLNFEVLREIT